MRQPTYLSPSSLAKFENYREEFYLNYLCPIKRKRSPQVDFMSVGSAFDAFAKNRIHIDVYGETATEGTDFEFGTIFEAQVEPHLRDFARERGQDLFDQYVMCGAYSSLLADIMASPYAPEMEFTVQGEVDAVPLLGKPDLRYVTKDGVHIICDWKVNGSTSHIGASPFPGYQISRDAYGSNTHNKAYRQRRLKTDPADKEYKDYKPLILKDVELQDTYLEDKCDYWADQLAIYSWLLGEPVGSEDFVVRMEQIACRPVTTRNLPRAKFSTHMNRIGARYQEQLVNRIHECWNTIRSGHIFTNMTREASDARCQALDARVGIPSGLHPILSGCLKG